MAAALLRDWFTSIDLTDTYFHIPISPPHRKYLRFAFKGITYLVLPVGLSLSPRVEKCTEAARRGECTWRHTSSFWQDSHPSKFRHTPDIKLGKECFDPNSTHHFHHITGFSYTQSTSVSGEVCLRLLGLMASALAVIPLPLINEAVSAVGCVTQSEPDVPQPRLPPNVGLHSVHPRSVHLEKQSFLTTGVTMGTILVRNVITTDASLGSHRRGQDSE
ncbi:hypothetical protein N1851_031259 [Merluccius polli]|uniref:Uncharacterized protein n=1 Tax=Merluccius polli TaxID=89951 RepID=A0AA47M422_MERPO|nr:hypothetical protein N1851_031259 [Merluccius polli]